MTHDNQQSLIITFEDASRARYAGGRIDSAQFRQCFRAVVEAPSGFFLDTEKGPVYAVSKFLRRGHLLISVFDCADKEARKRVGYAKVKKPAFGHVTIGDVRMDNPDYRGVGLGKAIYDYVDAQLKSFDTCLIPSNTPLQPNGRRFWEKRDPQALALRDLYRMLGSPEAEDVEITSDHVLWNMFSSLEQS